MAKKVEEILSQCIDDIKAGRASLEDCLDYHSDMSHELEPLLRVALSIKEPTDIYPSDEFKVRARVNLMEHIHVGQLGKKAMGSSSQAGVRHGWYTGWARVLAIVVAVALFIFAAGTGVAYASQSSLPGDTLYSVKLATEQLQRIITFDDVAEVELELKFASTRLDELEGLARMPADQIAMTTGNYNRILTMSIINVTLSEPESTYTTQSDRIALAIAGYEKNINAAINKAEKVSDSETSLETVALAILNHLDRLDDIGDMASEGAREFAIHPKEVAIDGYISALRDIVKVNPIRAYEINLQAMQCRLDRVFSEAEKGDFIGVGEALQQFEELNKFGEEIIVISYMWNHGTLGVDVDELNARATLTYLEVLGSIYMKVSEDMKTGVEEAITVLVEGHRQAVRRLQEKGVSTEMYETLPLPNEIMEKLSENITNQQDSEPGSGEEPSSGEGTGNGEEPGSGEGTGNGEEPSSGEGTGNGEEPGSGEGTGNGEEPGNGEGTGNGEEPDSGKGPGNL